MLLSHVVYKHRIQFAHTHTSRCIPSRLAVPPFAQSTGRPIELPAIATARAEFPSPITTTPANGWPSLCWHSDVSTRTENLAQIHPHITFVHRLFDQHGALTVHSAECPRRAVATADPADCQTAVPYRSAFEPTCDSISLLHQSRPQ